MSIRGFRRSQAIIGVIPSMWVLSYLGYVCSTNGPNTLHLVFDFLAFFLLIAAWNSVWLWIFLAVVGAVVHGSLFDGIGLVVVSLAGMIAMVLIVVYDPGGFVKILVD